jgi:Domain of unknown function (DUF4395)
MTLNAQSTFRSGDPDAKRNFILQQGLCEPEAGTCPLLYSALRFQPWVVGSWVVVAAILQGPYLFFALAAVLWWSALVPHLNPFDAFYNFGLARLSGITLTSAPAPRRFAQFLAGSFALAIGVSLALGWRMTVLVLEGFFMVAIGALLFGGFCFGSFVFHLLCGRADFAKRTLPWATGA